MMTEIWQVQWLLHWKGRTAKTLVIELELVCKNRKVKQIFKKISLSFVSFQTIFCRCTMEGSVLELWIIANQCSNLFLCLVFSFFVLLSFCLFYWGRCWISNYCQPICLSVFLYFFMFVFLSFSLFVFLSLSRFVFFIGGGVGVMNNCHQSVCNCLLAC